MAKTEAELQIMEKTAREFETVNGELQQMLTRLMDELQPLRQKWQGAGGHSFEQVKRAFQDDQIAINTALRETAAAIRTSGQSYATTDETSAADLTRSYTSKQLPL
ncbi:WXG100 family type VII secretion target [Longispora sp. NPDC051575]|uniref:WXG100 family type VII secretion target n=1 Tax=Longispora sp. NPDC051575 TaxID=3154943 RepID=UPI003430CA57